MKNVSLWNCKSIGSSGFRLCLKSEICFFVVGCGWQNVVQIEMSGLDKGIVGIFYMEHQNNFIF